MRRHYLEILDGIAIEKLILSVYAFQRVFLVRYLTEGRWRSAEITKDQIDLCLDIPGEGIPLREAKRNLIRARVICLRARNRMKILEGHLESARDYGSIKFGRHYLN
jgi:hypothetical protein